MKSLADNIRTTLRSELATLLKNELSQLVQTISKDLTAAVIASVRSELASTGRAVVQEITPSSPLPPSPHHKRSKPADKSKMDLTDVSTVLDHALATASASSTPIPAHPPEAQHSLLR
jgi:hypothetical protein